LGWQCPADRFAIALVGYELVEGEVTRDLIREKRRIGFAPESAGPLTWRSEVFTVRERCHGSRRQVGLSPLISINARLGFLPTLVEFPISLALAKREHF
jgi:hypothetical protein